MGAKTDSNSLKSRRCSPDRIGAWELPYPSEGADALAARAPLKPPLDTFASSDGHLAPPMVSPGRVPMIGPP